METELLNTDLLHNAQSWVVNNQELIIRYTVNMAAALLTLIIGFIAVGMLTGGINKVLKARKVDSTISEFVTSLLKYGLLAFVIIAALGRVGVQTASFVAVVGAAGLAIGLALQGSLSNFAAGVLLIGFRFFKAGDYIEAGGTAGTVHSVQIFTTILMTADNRMIVVPNSKVLNDRIVNYSKESTRRLDLVIGVSYNADLKLTKEVLSRILDEDPRVLKDPAYRVAVNELGASSVDFIVRPWVKSEDYWTLKFDLLEKIKNELDANNIGIPFPQMDVHLIKQDQA
ncbi:small-conductance mechanosensitive channel MscS [Oceanimonas baumannii]|uniref:Small-conductance mechanosensitive channel n=1 Tax=Oceanimonas baumannii TaxID=129578 RepID=A0A235CIW7_9GAMM|nr:small-conductance mechanosensitive channel MscS [Oceanimonas baumannii]MCC4263480.1 small-conductance mechanosensitive channel MscS [Oceanimonas baumannii]OYD24349.1 mechanosensitive ion channel protein [Oceanimonas baumannii]TDW59086.1 small conductance mechanosensitive channel [Oceanimonas baumannii]